MRSKHVIQLSNESQLSEFMLITLLLEKKKKKLAARDSSRSKLLHEIYIQPK